MKMNKSILLLLIGIIPCLSLGQAVSDSIYSDSIKVKYGFGGGCGIGGGYTILTENLSNYLPNNGSLDIGFNFEYDRFIYDFTMNLNNFNAKSNYAYNNTAILKDSTSQLTYFGNTLGYFIIDRPKLLVYPFSGIINMQLSQFSGDEKMEVYKKMGYTFGCVFDYKFSSTYDQEIQGDFILGSRFSYNMLDDYEELNASNFNLSVYFRFMIRSYRNNG